MEGLNTVRASNGNSLLKDPCDSILLDVPYYKPLEKKWINPKRDQRNINRAIQREADKVVPLLSQIEEEFVQALFDDQYDFLTYKELYDHFLEEFHFNQDRIKHIFDIKSIELYEHHFSDMFAPLEKEKILVEKEEENI